MTEERTTALRERMIEDMRILGLGPQSQRAHIRAAKDFTGFLGRSPDTATTEELRAYQLHMTDTEVTPSVCNARIAPSGKFVVWTPDPAMKIMGWARAELAETARQAFVDAQKRLAA